VQLQLKPGLRRLDRGPASVQIGLSAARGTVIDGLTPEDRALLEHLADGVDPQHPPTRSARARALVQLLAEAGVLVPARSGRAALSLLGAGRHRLRPDAAVWSIVHPGAGDGWELLAARCRRHVRVVGAGRTGASLAGTLAAAGVGTVTVQDPRAVDVADLAPAGAGPPDVGTARDQAAAAAVARWNGPAPAIRARRPDLVVLVEHAAADAARAGELLRTDVPHLSVVVRDDVVVIGPLVRPGAGPCLRCLDLHRTERDPAWPRVLAQLLSPAADGAQHEETALSVLTAGLAGLQVLAQLDGLSTPASVGATLEVELPDGMVSRRPWPAHPACGCHWPPRRAAAGTPGPASQDARQ
jgi:hypothetical protein